MEYLINPRTNRPIATLDNVKAALANNGYKVVYEGSAVELQKDGVKVTSGTKWVEDKITEICKLEDFYSGLNKPINLVMREARAASWGIK